jgi:hypothetical protein
VEPDLHERKTFTFVEARHRGLVMGDLPRPPPQEVPVRGRRVGAHFGALTEAGSTKRVAELHYV